jgi:hypothetical protein
VIFLYSKTGSPKKSQSGSIPNPISSETKRDPSSTSGAFSATPLDIYLFKSEQLSYAHCIDFEIEVLTFVCLKSRFLYETTLHILTTILEECSSTPREKTVDKVQL